AVWEIWPYLAAGASLHVPPDEVRGAPGALVAWLAAHAVTIAFLPTPLAQAALGEAWPAGMPLRCLLTGGEALERPPRPGLPFTLVNHYGPTEATVLATAAPVAPEGAAAPAIGRPVEHARVALLDRALRPVPAGAVGEICIGGAGLARGYRGLPALTAERFVPDPAGAAPGARLYRTGDLAVYRPSGELAFRGRG